MENFFKDLGYGFRTLVKNVGFTIVAVVALALGTGANSAIFSVVNAVLLRPLPYGNPDELTIVLGKNLKSGDAKLGLSVPDFIDYQSQNNVFEGLASFTYEDFNLSGGDLPEHVQGTMVSSNFFEVLGVNPVVGRALMAEDGRPGADRVVVISNGLWKRRFGSDPGLIGQSIMLNGASFTVIGVTPPSFQSPEKGDELWVPMSFDGGDRMRIPSSASFAALTVRSATFLKGVARIKPGVTREQAQEEMSGIASRLEQEYPNSNTSVGIAVIPIKEEIVGNMRTALKFLFGAVGFVLLIACANVANLLLSRAASRQKEIAIRVALGAGRFRLIRQLLTESVLLAIIGGALGLALAFGAIKLLVAINPANIPRLGEIDVDGRVLGFTLLVSVLTGVVFGLVPAWQATKPDLNETLKAEGARGSTGGIRKQRARSLLVISEVALTVLLLIGAGLMIKSFYSLQKVQLGFNPENVLTMQVNLPAIKYAEDSQITSFYDQVLQRVQALPGVQAAGAATSIPLMDRVFRRRFTIDGRPPATPNERLLAHFRSVSHDYHRAMGIPLRKGRYFTEQDRDKSAQVIIINDSMARRYWPDEEPVGKHITIPGDGPISREIVGVVADVKHEKLDAESGPEMYVPYLQKPFTFMGLVVRTGSDPAQMTNAVRSQVLAVDDSQAVYDIKTMQQMVGESVSQPRLNMLLLTIFAGIALVLAAVGIYGVMSTAVSQRKHEIGIRLALGAQASDILKMIVGQGMILAVVGMVIGVVMAFMLALSLTSAIEGFLFGVSATDLTIFIGIPLLLAFVAFLSCYIPARRATRVDPMIALRAE
ncbi:MAG TPA: ABC transporter permease [Blastocatellia bacterium]|nr:ABC transporter permease [Blastocatellia bacterium]